MDAKPFLVGVLHVAFASLWLWDVGAIAFSPYASEATRTALAVAFAGAVPAAYLALRKRRAVLALVPVVLVPALAWLVLLQPSNERAWAPDQARLSRVELVNLEHLTLRNVRNFTYRGTADFDARWEERSYELSKVDSAWFVVEPFSSFPGAAHTFLSFGFENGDYVAVSVEIRKEAGESFSALKGLYRNYELMYVFGDERDLVRLRTEHRKDTVYVYPLKASKEVVRAMFLDILVRAQTLQAHPEFYNSVVNTCTTNIARHANRVVPGAVPFSWHVLLPGYSDERALELGLIDFDGPIEAARERFRVNGRASAAAGAPDFSARIRSATR